MEKQTLWLNENDTVHLGNGATLTIQTITEDGEVTFAIDGWSSMVLHDPKTNQLWRNDGMVRGEVTPMSRPRIKKNLRD